MPSKGGYLRAGHGPDALMTEVSKGTVLGAPSRVRTPSSVSRSSSHPWTASLFGVARDYMVRPGDWAYFVAESKHADSAWIDRSGSVSDTASAIEQRARTQRGLSAT